MMRQRFRQIISIILMVLGMVMLIRGIENSMKRSLGWQGALMSAVLGLLVFALGFTRWRYLSRR
jgi:uncharacterized membrane protein